MLLRVLKNITETRFQKNTFILLLTTSLQTSQQSLIYQIFLIVCSIILNSKMTEVWLFCLLLPGL